MERCGEAVAENARLYNEVQDLKGKIRVFCRVRPLGATGDGAASCTEVGVDGQVGRALRSDRGADQVVDKINRGADQGRVLLKALQVGTRSVGQVRKRSAVV